MLSPRPRPRVNISAITFTALFTCVLFLASPVFALAQHLRHSNLHIEPVQRSANDQGLSHRHLSSRFHAAIIEHETSVDTPAAGQGDYTCGPNKPCYNGACCGDSGWCGFGPTYCGKGCQSNCNATADCGQFAHTPGSPCPLNVCCSEFGFCGTTSDFCGKGCQSNCQQPKPSGPSTNVQQRIIGYWEAWNSQHPCGTMAVGEIPVNYLTHLNIAFGYISHDFRITNMDGVSSDLYRNLGNLKARNPNLKIVISLGGWAFSDPGPWRSVFPTMTSSSANRATFIQNLLGFLSEYGYDGVDFDWEYPGADDRGGSDADAANYVALLKELRAAIASSGHSYIVTFTAPTSYWYLRHFDIKSMASYVDWINLMSYDLHGVWDSTNPIGSQVLAHTNLTEIDLALDLFWRAEIDPSNIVLGLAFYGRTFNLKSSSCWKPGCPFGGPGDAGPCTDTAGILSYREIQTILDQTGAASYLDKEAAVRYLVYGNNSWVSFDDDITFQAKIDYASKIGLSGLMVWAVDLDDSKLNALRAISGASGETGADSAFSLVDLKYLFPSEDLPSSDSQPSYGLVTFGSGGDLHDVSPASGPFGFFLVAGDSHVVTNLKKRKGEPEPFTFLDCPSNVRDQPEHKVQSARVTCLSDDLEGCFRILERGVEGTIVEMPDNCAPNSFARAISLNISPDQSVPLGIRDGIPPSPVYDFSFDFNLGLMRRDSDNTRFRLDYSNVPGYWNHLVNAPGIQSRDLNNLESRFFAPTTEDWNTAFETIEFDWSPTDATQIQEDVSAPVFWQSAGDCSIGNSTYAEGFGAFVQGKIDAQFWFGFSMIATLKDNKFDVHQAHGFLKARGQTDLTYGIGGIGDIDISKAGKGNPAISDDNLVNLKGHTINTPKSGGRISLNPYYQLTYQMATFNGSTGNDFENSVASFNGRLTTRIITDLGDFQANFPPPENLPNEAYNDKRQQNKISIPENDILYGTSNDGGHIAIGTNLIFGLKLEFFVFGDLFRWDFDLPKMNLVYNTMEIFTFSPGSADHPEFACSDYEVITNVYQTVEKGESLGWNDSNALTANLAYDRQIPSRGQVCYPAADSSKKRRDIHTADSGNLSHEKTDIPLDHMYPDADCLECKKQSLGPRGFGQINPWQYSPYSPAEPSIYFVDAQDLITFDSSKPKFDCRDCQTCYEEEVSECCGCVSLDVTWPNMLDMSPCDIDVCEPLTGAWLGTSSISKRQEDLSELKCEIMNDTFVDDGQSLSPRQPANPVINITKKRISVCKVPFGLNAPYNYPSFPENPNTQWDGGKFDAVSRYWGNTSGICQSWAVGKVQPADVTYIPNSLGGYNRQRSLYQTEHPFEAQLISNFFTNWLDKGRLNDLDQFVYSTPKMPCAVTKAWVNKVVPDFQILRNGVLGSAAFPQLLLTELGSQQHQDRLTIMLARLNGRKGRMFQGHRIVIDDNYKLQTQQEQLLVAKEVGMIFNYFNTKEVWDMFCASYEAMYDHMGAFNTFYARQGQAVTIPDLQTEWEEFVRTTLDNIVTRSLTAFDMMYENRRAGTSFFSTIFPIAWLYNKYWNRGSIRLTGTCPHLGATRV
ncbi:uncharacterized protein TrAtP1_000187 [Trichoderma atroviride]|uniref:uncharacterized protein n=1 Tax=Hypocrea atroviridis TaxID=63577 RepID=UPI003321EC3E|nr:hypothetical protein TrAtP1_000187 [Trichoderma atroviride]